MASKVWMPIDYLINDSLIELHADEMAITIGWDDTAHATMAWPIEGGYAVCELVDAPPTVPLEVREAIETLLSWREHGKAYDTVRAWLEDAQGKEGDGGN